MANSTYQEVGHRIRQARMELGLIQADLGRMLSRPRSHAAISDIERGKTKLNLEELRELADVLQKPLAFFIEPASRSDENTSLVYRRSQLNVSDEQERKNSQAIKDFMRHARSLSRKEDR